MTLSFKAFVLAFAVLLFPAVAKANDPRMSERVLGKADAPITVDEFVSLTCSHCADFYIKTLPELEKKYVDSGKVKFVYHDFPLDGISLKGSALARCMPKENFFPFIKALFANQMVWAFGGGNPETNLIRYANMAGMTDEQVKACLKDTKLMDAIVAERQSGAEKFKVDGTPAFIINDGVEIINGAQPAATFTAAFDKILATKK